MRGRSAFVLLTLWMSVATAVPAANAQTASAPITEAPRQVTGGANPVRLFDIPALAVDPRDPNTVVMAVGDSRNGGCGLQVSRDAGL